jgi:NlpC/P60 family
MSAPVLTPRPPVSGSPLTRPRGRSRKWLLAPPALLLLAAVAVVAIVASVLTGSLGGGPGSFGALLYNPNSSAPITVRDPRLADLNQEQLHNSVKIIAEGIRMAVPVRGWIIALATASQESDLINLDHGDRDSVGLFQQRPSQGWGTKQQIMDPAYATNKFLSRLVQVPDWPTLPLTVAAQEVQRSAFPDAYARWEPRATALVEDLVQSLPPTGEVSNASVLAAIDFAKAQLGKPYLWGATGPDAYDCSREQWDAGSYLPVALAQAGDLIFYGYDTGDPNTIHHVAMYLGNGSIIEAQQNGVPVHIRPFSFDEAELMPYAVRVRLTH